MTDEDYSVVEVCPNCDEASRHRARETADPSERFECRECGHTYAEPVVRGRKPNVGGLSAAGKAALEWGSD